MAARNKSKSFRRSPFSRLVLRIVLPYGTLLLTLTVVFFRLQAIRPITGAVRVFNKRYGNPAMMKLAGRRYWFAGLIRHTGRRSGREYATPIWAVPMSDGFLISLPFGENVDWLKNVLATSRATIEAKGETWTVVEPEVISRGDAQPLLPWHVRLMFELAGIERFLKLSRLSEAPSATVGEGDTRTTVNSPV